MPLPPRYRDAFHEGILLSQSPDRCLRISTPRSFDVQADDYIAEPPIHRKGRVLRRVLFGRTYVVELDKQNRILVPQQLRDYAGLSGKVLLVGAGETIENLESRDLRSGNAPRGRDTGTDTGVGRASRAMIMSMTTAHIPVMLSEVLDALDGQARGALCRLHARRRRPRRSHPRALATRRHAPGDRCQRRRGGPRLRAPRPIRRQLPARPSRTSGTSAASASKPASAR